MDESVNGHVRCEMIDAVDRAIESECESFRGAHADEQCADETGTRRDRDRVDIAQRHARLGSGPIKGGIECLQVSPAGDLGDHAAKARLLVHA